jgi:hypothetical protein
MPQSDNLNQVPLSAAEQTKYNGATPGPYSVEDIAKMCHETNKHFTRLIGDYSQHSWEEAEEWQRQSAIEGVKFALENPDASASAQHDAWCRDKVKDGWKYGPAKDAEKKEHHCLVPYCELPQEQRTKDHLFKAIVKAMLATD